MAQLGLRRTYFRHIFSDIIDTIVWDGQSGRIEGVDEVGERFAFEFSLNGKSVLLSEITPKYHPDSFPSLLNGCRESLFKKLFA